MGNITSKSDQGSYSYDGNQGQSYANPHAVTSKPDYTGQWMLYEGEGKDAREGEWSG